MKIKQKILNPVTEMSQDLSSFNGKMFESIANLSKEDFHFEQSVHEEKSVQDSQSLGRASAFDVRPAIEKPSI